MCSSKRRKFVTKMLCIKLPSTDFNHVKLSLYHRELILAVSGLPQTQNNYCKKIFGALQLLEKHTKFLEVHQVGLMTLRECRVDRPFPYHMTRCWVRTEPRPPQHWQWVAYLNRLIGV
jgi:hypothetical protein